MPISDDELVDQSQTPKQVRTDEGQVLERSVNEMIDADRYVAARNATAVPWGMKIARTKPGGTV